ncbi:MAG: hypothetical protein II768_10075, partial [Clostridia bacterium]|nr:hypothetical protein [Clostridia bacterium]
MKKRLSFRLFALLLTVLLAASGCDQLAPSSPEETVEDRIEEGPDDVPPETLPTETAAAEIPFTPPAEEEEDGVLRVYMDNLGVRMYLAANPDAEVEIVCTEDVIAAEGFDEDIDLAERLRSAEGGELPDV